VRSVNVTGFQSLASDRQVRRDAAHGLEMRGGRSRGGVFCTDQDRLRAVCGAPAL